MKLRNSSCTLFVATALALAGCGDSDTTTTYTNPVPDLLMTMGEQSRKAFGAKGSADMSLKDATTKATMLSAVKVKGESSDAEANAKAILDAKAKVDSALMEANAALTALQEAKTEADALPADTPKLEELKAELATAITDATAHRDAIKSIRDATGKDSLAKLVEKVTGTGDKKMTPADIAAAVAVEVEKVLTFSSGFGGAPRPPITGGIVPTTSKLYLLYALENAGFGDDKLDQYYAGITLYDLPGVRMRQTDYANYGYWLGIHPGEDNFVASYHFGVSKDSRSIPASNLKVHPSLEKTATYSGQTLGLSVLTVADGNNHKAIKSGEFTADVKLTATFAAKPTVKGTIDNFKGNAVGADWSVELKGAPLLAVIPTAFDAENYGLTRGNGAKLDGTWTARAGYMPTEVRPNSITGNFRAVFPNGRAAGGYAVVKDE